MAGKHGVDALKSIVDLGMAVAGFVKNASLDGKIDLNDIGFLIPIIPTLGPFFEKLGTIDDEFLEIDKDDEDNLVAYTKPKLDASLTDEKIREIVRHSLRIGLHVGGLLSALKSGGVNPVPAPVNA